MKPGITVAGKCKMHVHGDMVHLVDMRSVGRGYSRCGLYLRSVHGTWVDYTTPITCITCMVRTQPFDPKQRSQLE